MPRGPRSYGGGGGSRSSGGGGFSGGFGGGFRSSGPRHHGGPRPMGPRRPFRMHFGPSRVLVLASGAVTWVMLSIFALIIGLMLSIGSSSALKEAKSMVSSMEADEAYYLNLVNTGDRAKAENIEAVYAFYYDGYEIYQIEYTYKNKNGKVCEGLSYANYTWSQVVAIENSKDSYMIAYDSDGYSIPVDYKLDCTEYHYWQNTYKSQNTLRFVGIAIIAGAVLVSAIVIIKNVKKDNGKDSEATQMTSADFDKHCEYCGTKIDKNDKKCNNCGARLD